MGESFKCSICGPKFWNNFCRPRQGGVFLVLVMTILVLVFLLFFVYFALYFEALSKHHSDAYLILFVANLIHLILTILVLHFLSVPPKSLTFLRAATIYTFLIIAAALSTTAIVLWNTTPSNADIRGHVTTFFHAHRRVPRIYHRLQIDSKCCGVGIKGFEDYVPKTLKKKGIVEILPDSCCVSPIRRRANCGNFRGHFINESRTLEEIRTQGKFHIKGCFSGLNFTYANLKTVSPTAYSEIHLVLNTVWISPILIFLLLIIFTYYACYILPKDAEGGPEWVRDEFKAKLRSNLSLQCFRGKGVEGDEVLHPRPDFARFHELMKPKLPSESGPTRNSGTWTGSGTDSGMSLRLTGSNTRRSTTVSPSISGSRLSGAGRSSYIPIGTSSNVEITIDKDGHFVVADSNAAIQPGRSSGQGTSPEAKKKSKVTSWFGS